MKLFGITLLFFIELLSINVIAQPSSGDFLLGGDVAGRRTKVFYPDTSYESTLIANTFKFSPRIGIFITDRIAIGGFTNIIYFEQKRKQLIEDTIKSTRDFEESKFSGFVLSNGGFLSYYYPIKETLISISEFSYEYGYSSDGVSLASFISDEQNNFKRNYFSRYTIQTGVNYFFKPYLSLSAFINLFNLQYTNNSINITLLSKDTPLSIGINYIIQSDDE